LHRGDLDHFTGGLDLLDRNLREADLAYLALILEFPEQPELLLTRDVFVDAVQLEKVDGLPPEPPQTHQTLTENPDAVYLDVRTESEFAQGHPAGAINIPVMVAKGVGQMQLKAFENTDGWDEEEIEGSGLEPAAAARLAEVRAPTRILVGELDVAAVGRTADRLAGEIPGASLVRWPDVAHLPSLERPDDFNRLALDWFAAKGFENGRSGDAITMTTWPASRPVPVGGMVGGAV